MSVNANDFHKLLWISNLSCWSTSWLDHKLLLWLHFSPLTRGLSFHWNLISFAYDHVMETCRGGVTAFLLKRITCIIYHVFVYHCPGHVNDFLLQILVKSAVNYSRTRTQYICCFDATSCKTIQNHVSKPCVSLALLNPLLRFWLLVFNQ